MIKNINKAIMTSILSLGVLTACNAEETSTANQTNVTAAMTSTASATTTPAKELITGIITETMDGGGYTYMSLKVDGESRWVAGPKTPVTVGSTVSIAPPMAMNNFKSAALKREFATIYFTGKITNSDGSSSGAMPHKKMSSAMPAMAQTAKVDPHAGIDMNKMSSLKADAVTPNEHASKTSAKSEPIKGIKKAKDGKTIDDILKQKKDLAGKSVKIRGKVVKYTSEVMNKNWIHIKDSSTGGDLTVTTNSETKVGDTIIIDGKVAVNKDFGYGYIYDVIVEDAKVTIE